MSQPVSAADLQVCGLDVDEAALLAPRVGAALAQPAPQAWTEIARHLLRPEHPFALHQALFAAAYRDWDEAAAGPAPAWVPDQPAIAATNVGRLLRERGLSSVAELHAWSVNQRADFWAHMIERLGIRLAQPCSQVLDTSAGVEQPRWLVGAKMNIAESCFQADRDKPAIVYHGETGERDTVTYGELEALANRVANGLIAAGFRPGDPLAIDMPMNVAAVAIYLGIIKAGCVAVSIADSLAPFEIAVRLRLSEARGIFTQHSLLRGGKQLPLYAKVIEAGAPRAIVLSEEFGAAATPLPPPLTPLRPGDLAWNDFLSDSDRCAAHLAYPGDTIGILFSSGTTGDPKAIPWTHTTPIKCVVDACLHQDVQPHDRVAWPTNLGWMMGPWLIYASLVSRATMALYGGAPTGRDFGRFVADARVTMLGVIPSLVKTWRATDCMRGLDWSSITRFSSTGECSNPHDMLYLMSLARYQPVIEYCGGTELGGGYIGSTLAQANVPSAFSTPSFGTEMLYAESTPLDARAAGGAGAAALSPSPAQCDDDREVFLVPPAIGMSTTLVRHDHHAVYYAGTPRGPQGQVLRRHGDTLVRLPGGYYRALGRVDDTMNLGGIKVSSAEIERAANAVPGISETAAIAVPPPGGGPSTLVIFAVLAPDCRTPCEQLQQSVQQAIRAQLNPLFKVERLVAVDQLPRTPSHKVMRRLLREQASPKYLTPPGHSVSFRRGRARHPLTRQRVAPRKTARASPVHSTPPPGQEAAMTPDAPLRYGMFIMPYHPPTKPLAQSCDEDLELVVAAEELGFSEFWIGEHHTMQYETIVMPEIFIARALAETSTIRLGPAPVCLQQHHPAHVACRLAFLDHLSKGRLNLCFGAGSVTADQELYGCDPKQAPAMVDEAIETILYLWSHDPPYEVDGKYWKIRLRDNVDFETRIGFIPKPLQRPHPPISVPGMSRNSPSMKTAARRGHAPFGHCLVPGNVLADTWQTYETAALEAGRTPLRRDWKVSRAIFLADTADEAIRRARSNSLGQNFEYIGRLFDKGLGRRIYKRDLEMSDADCNLDYLMQEQIIAGDVDLVLRRLLELIEETGPFGTLVLMSYDWDDKAAWRRSMELFAHELMPALNKALGAVPVS
ncbi:MAG: LLM class flavin-dependent oxidoreductase [Pirellulales bacterium]